MTEILNTLYVQTAGSALSLDGDSVRCHNAGDSTWRRLPLARVESIVLIGAVTASNPLLLRCADDGRPVHWLSKFGKPRATLLGPLGNQGHVRAAQHAAHANPSHRSGLSQVFVQGKMINMRAVLRAALRDSSGHRKQAIQVAIARIDDLLQTLTTTKNAPDRASILGLEGAATRHYFTALRHVLRPEPGLSVPPRRTHHPATDPVNSAMSFAYGLARSAVHGAVHAAGLDPSIGFLHGDRESQPSLVLDLLEEFRPDADRLVAIQQA